jgi:hypothetical protein
MVRYEEKTFRQRFAGEILVFQADVGVCSHKIEDVLDRPFGEALSDLESPRWHEETGKAQEDVVATKKHHDGNYDDTVEHPSHLLILFILWIVEHVKAA